MLQQRAQQASAADFSPHPRFAVLIWGVNAIVTKAAAAAYKHLSQAGSQLGMWRDFCAVVAG